MCEALYLPATIWHDGSRWNGRTFFTLIRVTEGAVGGFAGRSGSFAE
jgi:hypothetical protein